ncbi:PucR family transcriptional regulator [Lacticaseibacillus daqingensis]|uniref:PucR family transcriptional regulator n=1 Tax=Lacticaseibacillus daqingensis TaxID=2486014 RepID=UPI000F7AC594|nr:helix-turn-helix domain-containing protein [Lacticaseibacillus daqingensis]
MQLTTLLKQVVPQAKWNGPVEPALTVTQVRLVEGQWSCPDPHTMVLRATPDGVSLGVPRAGGMQCVAHVAARSADPTLPLRLLDACGQALAGGPASTEVVTTLAITALTTDFEAVLAQAAAELTAPLALLSLDGQHILCATSPLLAPSSHVGRYLANQVPTLDPASFYNHLYLTRPHESPLPLLLTPLAYRNEALGYLALAVTDSTLAPQQLQLLAQLAPLFSAAAVRAQLFAPTITARDRLVDMLLTAPVTETWAAQFARQHATLPDGMVLVEALPRAQQTPATLRERLKYLGTPMFAQLLITVYEGRCLALISVGLRERQGRAFCAQLTKLAQQARCRLIVSQWYAQPQDTAAAALVCAHTAQLGGAGAVVNCEDAFFDLMLTQVADGATVLPFFIHPALQTLTRHDVMTHGELVPTLRAYLEATCNQTETAAALYIHPNTLRRRLQRITSLTGLDLKDAETCFKLAASLKVQRYLAANHLAPSTS